MKIAIISNRDPQCGNKTYGDHLGKALESLGQVDFHTDEHPVLAQPYDVVFLNWHPSKVSVDVGVVQRLRSTGAKVILIFQNSYHSPIRVGPGDLLTICDAVVAHEEMDSNVPIVYMPHGILEVDGLGPVEEGLVATAGFPFPWKRPDVVVNTAVKLGCKALVFCPPYPGWDWQGSIIRPAVAVLDGRFEADTSWSSEEEVIQRLSVATVNIFWFQSTGIDDQYGQSGSARLGVAAQRPMIISRHRKFRDLIDKFGDELYIAETEQDVYRLAKEIMQTPEASRRKPERCLCETGWSSKVGQMYRDVVQEVMGCC